MDGISLRSKPVEAASEGRDARTIAGAPVALPPIFRSFVARFY